MAISRATAIAAGVGATSVAAAGLSSYGQNNSRRSDDLISNVGGVAALVGSVGSSGVLLARGKGAAAALPLWATLGASILGKQVAT